MNPLQSVSADSLGTSYCYDFTSATGVMWFYLAGSPSERVYIDRLGNVRKESGDYIRNPNFTDDAES